MRTRLFMGLVISKNVVSLIEISFTATHKDLSTYGVEANPLFKYLESHSFGGR